jgi:hypothetical protein
MMVESSSNVTRAPISVGLPGDSAQSDGNRAFNLRTIDGKGEQLIVVLQCDDQRRALPVDQRKTFPIAGHDKSGGYPADWREHWRRFQP